MKEETKEQKEARIAEEKRIAELFPRKEALKAIHGSAYGYSTDDGKKAYFKTPGLLILDAVKTRTGKSVMQFNKLLAENCFLEGDREIIEKDEYLLGLFDWLPAIIEKKAGELVKL